MIKTILFDLDGTLLPMEQETFVKEYFGGLSKKLASLGYGTEKLYPAIWGGVRGIIKNDTDARNEDVFWAVFKGFFPDFTEEDKLVFDEYYLNDFDGVAKVCGHDPRANETVKALKARGYRVALATNPVFPEIATRKRMAWAGLSHGDFEFYTTYEDHKRCKPNIGYYEEVLARLGADPAECMMVGNDVDEDMIAEKLGMKVFLLTDCLLNRNGKDISSYRQGSFAELMEYISEVGEY